MREFMTKLAERGLAAGEVEVPRGRLVDDRAEGRACIVEVVSGEIEVLSDAGGLVSTLLPGDVFGVSNLFSEDTLPARLRAKAPSVVRLTPKDRAIREMEASPELWRAYCAGLNHKLSYLVSRVSVLSLKSNRARVAAFLLSSPEKTFSSRSEMADFLAIGKSALFRELARFEDEGAISVGGGEIKVLDKELLEKESKL